MRILLLDDDPRDRFSVKRSLQREFPQAKIIEIVDAIHFRKEIGSGECDLVITKYGLPWINGVHILKQVKSFDPFCPVIMYTAGGSEEVAVDAMKLGLDDYIIASPGYFVRLRMAALSAVERAKKRRREAAVSLEQERLLMDLQEANATKDEFLARIADHTKELDRVNRELRASESAARHLAEELQESLSRERAAREAAEKNEHRSLVLSEASRILSSSLDVKRTLTHLVRLAALSIGDFCTIDLIHNGRIERVDAAHADPSRQELIGPLKSFEPVSRHSPLQRAVATGQTQVGIISEELLSKSVPKEERRRLVRALGLKSYMVVPLRSRGRAIGVMSLASSRPSRYAEPEVSLAEQLADRAAVALDNARLYTEVQRSDRLKDEFLATMSHELRTPLTSILGWTRILKGSALPEDKWKLAIATIDRNAAIEARLVEDILDASRIISGKLRLDFGPVDTAEILKSVVQSIRPSAEAADLQILEELPAVPSIRGSASRLEQVFGNLLSNAIKFTPPGGKVSVLLTQAGSRVEVRITDTGEGINREFIPHIFERFRQADSSLTRKHGGLGLGLAIARHIVELHGGTVAVESSGPGQGSTFLVSIPISDAGSRAADLRCAVKEVSSSALAGIQVLIVEDDVDSSLLLAEALEQYGAQVRSAESYQSALRLLEDRDVEIDVFLLDIGMPECDGYSLMAKVRAMRKYRQTPALAVTAFATDKDREMAFSAGFQGHVAKPFDPRALISQVAELVHNWPPEAVA